MCSGSETGSYLRLIDFVYHSTLGLRVIKKEKICKRHRWLLCSGWRVLYEMCFNLKLSGNEVYYTIFSYYW